jgi:hypothetical protein
LRSQDDFKGLRIADSPLKFPRITWHRQLEALIRPIWISDRAFRVDRPIQKLIKSQPAIVLDQSFVPALFKPIEDTP